MTDISMPLDNVALDAAWEQSWLDCLPSARRLRQQFPQRQACFSCPARGSTLPELTGRAGGDPAPTSPAADRLAGRHRRPRPEPGGNHLFLVREPRAGPPRSTGGPDPSGGATLAQRRPGHRSRFPFLAAPLGCPDHPGRSRPGRTPAVRGRRLDRRGHAHRPHRLVALHPYDGGAEVFARSTPERNRLQAAFADWRAEEPVRTSAPQSK